MAIVSSGRSNPTRNGSICDNSVTQELGWGIGVVAKKAEGFVQDLLIENNTVRGAGGSVGLFIPAKNVTIRGNTVTNNPDFEGKGMYGIMTYGTSGVSVLENNVQDADVELAYRIESCDGCTISGNRAASNTDTGIGLIAPTNCTLTHNVMEGNPYNFLLYPELLPVGSLPGNHIDTTNTIEGNPVLYFEGNDHLQIDGSAHPGTIYLYGCPNATIQGVIMDATDTGITAYRSSDLSISGCSLSDMETGIYIVASDSFSVQNNTAENCMDGIMAGEISSGLVSGNFIHNSGDSGIVAGQSLHNVAFLDNRIEGANAGIYLDSVTGKGNVTFARNRISGTGIAGISTSYAKGCTLDGNPVDVSGGIGLDIENSTAITVSNTTVTGKAARAVYLDESTSCILSSNTLNAVDEGVTFVREEDSTGSTGNTIANNRINADAPAAFYIISGTTGATNSVPRFTRRLQMPGFSIPVQAVKRGFAMSMPGGSNLEPDPSPPGNTWNSTKTAGPNIAGGPFLGGNYWANPGGTGFSQTHADRGDGFCNESFTLASGNTDLLPLHLAMNETLVTAPAVIDRPGSYRLANDLDNSTAPVAIRITASDVTLNGNGHTLRGASAPGSSGVYIAVSSPPLSHISVYNLSVEGWSGGIRVENVSRCTLENVRAIGNEVGFQMTGSPEALIRNCTADDNIPIDRSGIPVGGTGITIIDSPGSSITKSDISHNGWGEPLPTVGGYGINALNDTGLQVSGCTINRNVNTGIWNTGSSDMTVTGCMFAGNEGNGGIFMVNAKGAPSMQGTITDTIVSGSQWGIWVLGIHTSSGTTP